MSNIDELFEQVKILLDECKYIEVLNIIDKILELDPNNTEAYCIRAFCIGDDQLALEALNKAIELDNKNLIAYHNRADIKNNLGDFEGAIEDISKCIELAPNDKDICYRYCLRGFLYKQLNLYSKAIDDFDKSINLNKENCVAYYDRGYCKFLLNDKEGARADFNESLKYREQIAHCNLSRFNWYEDL